MNAPEQHLLPDIQSVADSRQLAIQRVGIRGVRHPLTVASAAGPLPTVATIEMTVGLSAEVKGTHMSRFLEVLQGHDRPIEPIELAQMLQTMLARLEAQTGDIIMQFPFFVRKAAPISGVESLLDHDVTLTARQDQHGSRVTMRVVVPVTSLCPCSKNISDYGAHNQRSHVTIEARLAAGASIQVERLITIAEQAASCELWGLLKRPDEKYVTERAYDNPKFVEDLVRDVAIALQGIDEIEAWAVDSENFESIHNHSAYARIEFDKTRPLGASA
jgi:GTP cyclohydrolase I